MATQTRQIAVLAGGLFTLEYDYDDATLALQTIRAVNQDGRSYQVTARSTSSGRTASVTVLAGATVTQNVPTGAAQRLQLSITPSGKLDGVEWSIV